MSSLIRLFLSSAAIFALAVSLSGCGKEEAAKAAEQPPPPQVTVAKPTKKLVAEHDEYVGRFVAMDYVEVRARVSGYLDKIQFADGQMVKKGDPLFTIDRRPFQASLDQAKAAVQQAEANLAYAKADLERGQSLPRGSVISQQSLDQRTQTERVAQANVAAQMAAERSADLDLQFTELAAPVSGRIGDRRVAPGNLVTGNTTLLATIASVDPIRLEFTMDEASYLRYTKAAAQAATDSVNRGLTLPVKLKLLDEKSFGHEGKIDFVDNAIDQSSGTIRGRAEFSNPDGRLTPGMFGRIQLMVSAPAEALLVPDDAIGTEQVRKFVYALGADNVATPKYVTLGQLVDNNMRVVTSGIDGNDTIVVNGLMRVRPGSKVSPQQAPEAKTAANADHAEAAVKPN
jgi:RND family efflux transporter MFP subunit